MRSFPTRYLSTDNAAMHPEPAAVTACLHSWSYKASANQNMGLNMHNNMATFPPEPFLKTEANT